MHATRVKKAGLLALILVALLGVALFAACDSIDGAGPGNGQPTDPTPGGDTSQRGTMTLSPSAFTLTVKGWTGGGLFFYFDLAGGKPPFVWSNSWTQMGLLIPLDDQGLGYANRAKYVVRDFGGEGDDTITVRDQSGAIVTAKFTKVIDDPDTPGTPSITPTTATIPAGAGISLIATSDPACRSFRWSTSDPTSSLSSTTGSNVTLSTVDPGGCGTSQVITVTVVDGCGQAATSTITAETPDCPTP